VLYGQPAAKQPREMFPISPYLPLGQEKASSSAQTPMALRN
jgi:hypothetical protein